MSVLVCVGVVQFRIVGVVLLMVLSMSVLVCVGVVQFRIVDVVLYIMDIHCRCWFVSVL